MKYFDRVKETATTTGTGDFTLAGAATGFRTFASVLSTNDTCYYCISVGSEWEVGLGTYSAANTLTRTTVLSSSNSNNAVNFSAGTKDVFLTVAARGLDTSGTSFPSSPVTGERRFRTDRGIEYYYDGTRWLSLQMIISRLGLLEAFFPMSATGLGKSSAMLHHGANGLYVVEVQLITLIAGTSNASNYWTLQPCTRAVDLTTHNVGSSFNTQSDTANVWARHDVSADSVVTAGDIQFFVNATKTGSPGNMYYYADFVCRFIG